MSCFGNVIWLIFGGFISGLGYIIGGLLTCLTIIGIPFGVQAMKLGVATMAPFGMEVRTMPDSGGCLQTGFNVGWAIFFGWEIALAHVIQIIGEAARRVSPDYQKAHPEIPWREIVGMRHKIVHDYLAVDDDVVWSVVTKDLQPLAEQLEDLLASS